MNAIIFECYLLTYTFLTSAIPGDIQALCYVGMIIQALCYVGMIYVTLKFQNSLGIGVLI
jgi:hypothetical protein